jgi:hypothetical protein
MKQQLSQLALLAEHLPDLVRIKNADRLSEVDTKVLTAVGPTCAALLPALTTTGVEGSSPVSTFFGAFGGDEIKGKLFAVHGTQLSVALKELLAALPAGLSAWPP